MIKYLQTIMVACLISSIYCSGTAGSSYTFHNNTLKYGLDSIMRVVFPESILLINQDRYIEEQKITILIGEYQNLASEYLINHTIFNDEFKFTLSNNYFKLLVIVTNDEPFTQYMQQLYITLTYEISFSLNEVGSIKLNSISENNISCSGYFNPEGSLSEAMMQDIVTAFKQDIAGRYQQKINQINNYLSNLPLETLLPTTNVLLNLSFNQDSSQTQNTLVQNMFGMENSEFKNNPPYSNSISFPTQNSEQDVVFLLSEYTLNTISTILMNDQKLVGSINQLQFPESFQEGIKYFQQVECSFNSSIKLETAPTFEITNSQIVVNADNLIIETYAKSQCGQPALINKIKSNVRFILSATVVENKSIKLTVTEGTLISFVQLINYMNYVDGIEVQNFIQNTINQNILRINQNFFMDTIPFNMNSFIYSEATLSLIDYFIKVEANLLR